MALAVFTDNAKVMSQGQITIPKDIREILGVSSGDYVSFIVEGNSVRIVNSAIYAMQTFQKDMNGEAIQANLISDEDVIGLINEVRNNV